MLWRHALAALPPPRARRGSAHPHDPAGPAPRSGGPGPGLPLPGLRPPLHRRWTVGWWGEGRPVFHDPRGGAHYDGAGRAPELPDAPVTRLVDDNARHGVRPDGWTAGARWERERDVPWAVMGRFQEAAAG